MQSLKIFNCLAILIVSVFYSCSADLEGQSTTNSSTQETIRYLALGDSYTIGQGVAEELRWPNQLAKLLEANGYKILNTNIIARTGWTTKNLLDAIESQSPGPHDLVSLLIGVNNQFQGKPFKDYKSELVTLIDKSIEIAGSKDRVFMVSIPDYGVTPFGASNSKKISEELDAYNAYAKERCDLLGIPFINITEISRSLGAGEGALASDQLHPSGQQYSQWADTILSVVVDLLKG